MVISGMLRCARGWGIVLPMLFVVCLSACVKNVELIPVNKTSTPGSSTPVSTSTASTTSTGAIDNKDQKLIAQGTFVNRVHTVKGTVSVYEKGSSRTLTFTNFSTDGGPDLRIYVAEDAALTNFIEVSKLTITGNFSVDLPYNYSPTQHKTVIIWCKEFSVLFGTAALTLN